MGEKKAVLYVSFAKKVVDIVSLHIVESHAAHRLLSNPTQSINIIMVKSGVEDGHPLLTGWFRWSKPGWPKRPAEDEAPGDLRS